MPKNKFSSSGGIPYGFESRVKARAKELGIRLTDKKSGKSKSHDLIMKEILIKINKK